MNAQILKKYAVWLILGLTLLATYWTTQQEENQQTLSVNTSALQKPERLQISHVESQKNSPVFQLRANTADTPNNLFTVINPIIEQNENAAVAAEPQTPSNPYTYAGKLVNDGQVIVFLTDGTKNYAVQVGDYLGADWRIDAIYLPEVTFKYVPLNTQVKLYIGA